MKHRFFALATIALLSACANQQDAFPSLAPRNIERPDAPVVTPAPTPVAPDPALDAQIATKVDAFNQAVTAFDATLARVRPLATQARDAAVGSDAWIAAQTALADLDTARAQILGPLANLEALAIDRALAGKPPYPALEDALTKAEATDADRAHALDTLDAPAPAN